MDTIKSKLSLALLNAISPIIKPNSSKVLITTNNDILMLLKDVNHNYDFFFRVEKEEMPQGVLNIIFTCKPYSELENGAKGTKMSLEAFKRKLNSWFEYIDQYKSAQLVEDPIIKQYQEEFYTDFKIVDDDAEENRFNFSQQILLLNYIEKVEELIKNEVEDLSEEDKVELIGEVESLKKDVAIETKDAFIQKQSTFWAKVRKKSIKTCEFVIKEFAKEVIKEISKKGLEISWESLPHYIEQAKALLNN